MSASYILYVEAKVKDEWRCINCKVPKYDGKTGNSPEFEYLLSETYWNGSRSYFHNTYDKLRELGCDISFSDLSPELKERYKRSLEMEERGETTFLLLPVAVDYKTLDNFVSEDEYDMHGLVHKNSLFLYKKGDLEELWPVEHEELEGLSDKELEAYQYYEWDNDFGWNWGLKTVKKCASRDIHNFEMMNNIWFEDKIDYRIICIGG